MTSEGPKGEPREKRGGIPRPGSDPNTWAGLMKINMSTGEMKPIFTGRAPSNGAVPGHGGQRRLLGRSRSEVPCVRCREREDAVGADAGWAEQNTITYSR